MKRKIRSSPVSKKVKSKPRKPALATRQLTSRALFAASTSARTRLHRSIDRDRANRMADYRKRLRKHAAGTRARPLRILAEGDSWFDYPLGHSVIAQLETMTGLPIANMAHHGDEVRQMLALGERQEITKRLQDSVNADEHFDGLLFSGGGNDIVGDQLCIWLKDYRQGMSPEDVVDAGRLGSVLSIVEAGYRDLISIRDRVSPATVLFLHDYDFAVPTGKGACFVGPWLRPSLDFRGVPRSMQWEVVRSVLLRFEKALNSLAANARDVVLIQTQGTLEPTDHWWANELHPKDRGFEAIARKFHAALKQRFPQIQ